MEDECKDRVLKSQSSVSHSAQFGDDDDQGQIRADEALEDPYVSEGRAASAGASLAAVASALGSAAFSPSFGASPLGAASASPPSDEVQRVRLSRSNCMIRVLSR